MILSFRDQATEDFYHNRPTHRAARFPTNIRSTAPHCANWMFSTLRIV